MEKDSSSGKMGQNTPDSGLIISNREKGLKSGQMERPTRASTSTGKNTVTGNSNELMGSRTKGTFFMIKSRERGRINTRMVGSILGSGLTTRYMEKVSICGLMERNTLVNS